jgi:hypothetical protein
MSKRKHARTGKRRTALKVRARRPAGRPPAVIKRERRQNKRGCWRYCADRVAPPSLPSGAPPAGNLTQQFKLDRLLDRKVGGLRTF